MTPTSRTKASLLDKCRPIISGRVPTIDLTDDESAAVTTALRRVIEGDRFPHAPGFDPLRAALGKLDAAQEPSPPPKAPTAGEAGAAITDAKCEPMRRMRLHLARPPMEMGRVLLSPIQRETRKNSIS
jgi:hypothetical protein